MFINDGKVIFLAELITLVTDLMIAFLIGLIALAGNHIYIIEDDMIMDMPFYSLIESYDLRQDLSADSIYLMMELVPMDTGIDRKHKKGSD